MKSPMGPLSPLPLPLNHFFPGIPLFYFCVFLCVIHQVGYLCAARVTVSETKNLGAPAEPWTYTASSIQQGGVEPYGFNSTDVHLPVWISATCFSHRHHTWEASPG